MKKLLISIALLIGTCIVYSQDWSEPQIITDTNSVYANPFVAVYGETSWMFYEKHGEVTSIFKMNLNNPGDNVKLLETVDFNCRLPFLESWRSTNYVGFLFFVSDELGPEKLFASKFYDNDSLGERIVVIDNVDTSYFDDYFINDFLIGYTINNKVFLGKLVFTGGNPSVVDTEFVDSLSSNVQVVDRNAFWQRNENDSVKIVHAEYLYNQDSASWYWNKSTYIDSTGNSSSLSLSISDNIGGEIFVWVNNNEIKSTGSFDTVVIESYGLPNIRQLSMINWHYACKGRYIHDPFHLCFTTGQDGNSEIVSVGNFEYDSSFITRNNFKDENPKVFFGEFKESWQFGYSNWVYCIWQTHINGKVAISMSKNEAVKVASIEEINISDNYLKVSPNPFSNRLNISVNTYGSNAEVRIIDLRGHQLAAYQIHSNNNWQSINWQPNSQNPKGIYFVVLNLEGKKFVRKVVLQ